eukprot:CAMPEP_0182896514 /NCGR_PEP_ID=MMETSP0034_2-20130328/26317_1 /TAXON_ID=156128 /ORGANISM="Nephroselmis pyriformis, Strain CCMP717" /LENGTH=435 /DNA_ID=CAMNT_0025030385 /DNA_START=326 /DNA_END=1630 /DNA_ORIENTATION=+
MVVDGPVEYGFVSQQVVYDLQDIGNWKVRADAIETLQGLVEDLQDTRTVMASLPEFVRFLTTLLSDPNFKISLTTTQIFGVLVGKIGKDFEPYIDSIMPSLVEKLGDNKIVVRQANIKVLSKLVQVLDTGEMLQSLMGAMGHKNWRVREELVNLIIQAMLTCQSSTLVYMELAEALIGAVGDSKDKVRAVALEGVAVVAGAIGTQGVMQVVSDVGAPGDVRRMVQERLSPQGVVQAAMMPVINSDGLVEHPMLTGGGFSRPGTSMTSPQPGGSYSEMSAYASDHSGELPSPTGLDGRRVSGSSVGAGRERKPGSGAGAAAHSQIPWEVPAPRARTVHGRQRPPSGDASAAGAARHSEGGADRPPSSSSVFPPQSTDDRGRDVVTPLLKRRQARSPPRVDVGMSNLSPEKGHPSSTRSEGGVYSFYGDLDRHGGPL